VRVNNHYPTPPLCYPARVTLLLICGLMASGHSVHDRSPTLVVRSHTWRFHSPCAVLCAVLCAMLCASRFRVAVSIPAADSSCYVPSRDPRTSIHHPPPRTVGPRSPRRDLSQRQPLHPPRSVHGRAHSQGLLQPRTAPRGEGRERVGGHRGGSAQCWAAARKGGGCEDRVGVEAAGWGRGQGSRCGRWRWRWHWRWRGWTGY
jgi:hypothetical protein